MIVAILKDTLAGEHRVAMIPANLPALAKLGLEIVVEKGAGEAAGFPDAAYVEKGARVVGSRAEALKARHAFKSEMDDDARKALFPQNERLRA